MDEATGDRVESLQGELDWLGTAFPAVQYLTGPLMRAIENGGLEETGSPAAEPAVPSCRLCTCEWFAGEGARCVRPGCYHGRSDHGGPS